MKWFSNLRIRNKFLLVFSLEIFFWIIICAFAYSSLAKMRGLAFGADASLIVSLKGIVSSYIVTALILTLAFSLILVYLASVAIRSIVEPIEMLSKAAVLIAEGSTSGSVSSNRQDEIGQLARDMDKLLLVLQSLSEDLKNLSDRHNIAGDIYAKIDTEKYGGAYKEATELLNAMLWSYIADSRDILYCISEFTNGNFNTQLRSFPGMKSVANNVAYGLRSSLASLSAEMGDALSAAADGNFEIRIDESKYKGDWNTVASQTNRLLDSIADPIRETTDAMLEIFEGNLSPSIKGEFKGDFALIKTSAANAVESVLNNVMEITRLLTELSNMNTTVEIGGEFAGDYSGVKTAFEGIIASISGILSQISDVADSVETTAISLSAALLAANEDAGKTKIDNDKIDQLFSLLADMENSSLKTSGLVEIIEDIAHQTNLLVLSASVEVARAGEQGSGFGAVIEELILLVDRNKDAVSQAENIIKEALDPVKIGVSRIHSSLSEISAACGENEELTRLFAQLSCLPDEIKEQSATLKRIASGIKNETI